MTELRISIVGCSGAGKTTVARLIEQQLGIPRLELDGVYHQADWEPLATPAFQTAVTEFMDGHTSWVIDGNYAAVRDSVWERANTVLWLDPPRWQTMAQIGWRTLRRSLTREPLWNGNREPIREILSLVPERSILAWAWTRHPMYRTEYAERLTQPRWSHLQFHRLQTRGAVEDWLRADPVEPRPSIDAVSTSPAIGPP
jgi:adenylate kinase family enzyme